LQTTVTTIREIQDNQLKNDSILKEIKVYVLELKNRIEKFEKEHDTKWWKVI
jgi:hypothetical protein